MKKFNAFLVSVLATAALNAAVIEQVIVRQQWPWSTDIKVEYKLKDVTSPVDLVIQAFNGDVELPLPEKAVRGARYGISTDGIGQFVIDPVAAFGQEKIALANFKVKLSTVAAQKSEVIYKIVRISDGSVEDVTRASILNGERGSFETDYSVFGKDYKTDLTDVLVWTGVTNFPSYKTTQLVLRKIPAGSATPMVYYPGTTTVNISEAYWIGVFEFTQAQWKETGYTARPNYDENTYVAEAPADRINNYRLFNSSSGRVPPESDKNCLFGCLTLQTRLPFALPTCLQWMKASQGGNSTYFHTGLATPDNWEKNDQADAIGSYIGNGGAKGIVGLYAPNAYGLYDTFGSVSEMCRDQLPGNNAAMTDDYIGTIGNTVSVLGGNYLGKSKFIPENYADIGGDTPKRDYQMQSSPSYNPECGFRVMLPDSAFAQGE